MGDVSQMLGEIEAGEPQALERLFPLVYDELRRLAAAQLAGEKPGQTLQATALVHEAYLRLVGGHAPGVGSQEPGTWEGRGHFFAAAAEAMRRILVEAARRRQSLKRGGDLARQDFDGLDVPLQQPPEEVLGVHEVVFLHKGDGSLIYSLELRGEVVRWIRAWRPDALFTHDPTVVIESDGAINHADHRAIGQARNGVLVIVMNACDSDRRILGELRQGR
jgi:RNA polymerase sigma factor (TIGR02999 family)